jgi:hypothetical protein
MPINVKCPQCGHTLKAPDSGVGKKGKCPECGGVVEITAPPEPPVVDAEVLDAPGIYDQIPETGIPVDRSAESSQGAGGSGEARRPCPMCGEQIPLKAMKCRYCTRP